jgi:hypothetical protein
MDEIHLLLIGVTVTVLAILASRPSRTWRVTGGLAQRKLPYLGAALIAIALLLGALFVGVV